MAAATTFQNLLSEITAPEVPDRNQIKDIDLAMTVFFNQMNVCFTALSLYKPSNHDERRLKKAKFVELDQSVIRFQEVYPELVDAGALGRIQGKISECIRHLRKGFKDTGSQWVQMTMRGNLERVDADIDVIPVLKINPYQILPTLEEISRMASPFQKLRALQLALQTIQESYAAVASQRQIADTQELLVAEMQLTSSRRLVNQFAVYRLTAQESYEALAHIWARDANPEQNLYLKMLVDPKDRKWIALQINAATKMRSLATMLCGILKRDYYNNPAKTPLQHVLEWPKNGDITLGIPQRRGFLAKLEKLKNEKHKDPFMPLILQYLSNALDPKGNLRVEAIEKKGLTRGATCHTLGEVVVTLNRFNLEPEALLSRFDFSGASLDELGAELTLPFFPSSSARALKKEEVNALAQVFRAEIVKVFLATDLNVFLDRDPRLNTINHFTDHYLALCKKMLTSAAGQELSKNDQILLKNLTRFIERLTDLGEFTLSFALFMGLIGIPKLTAAMPKKEYDKLQDRFSPSKSFSRMRECHQELTLQGTLCLPSLQLLVRDCTQFRNQIAEFRRGMRIKLDQLGKKKLIQLYESVCGEGETKKYRQELAKAMKVDENIRVLPYGKLFNNWELLLKKWQELGFDADVELTAELRECMEKEIGVMLPIGEIHHQLTVLQCAFELYYRGYQTTAMQSDLAIIRSTPILQILPLKEDNEEKS